MKNLKLFILVFLVIFLLAGCAGKRTDISREDFFRAERGRNRLHLFI